jgi:CRP-like cAMP-binding protein
MHIKENIQFFSGYQGYVLQNICEKFEQKVFDRGDVIAHKGELNNKMVILLFGKAAMYSDDHAKHLERELKPNQYFGEKALKETETNEFTIIASKVSMCLVLSAEDFEENVFYLRH